MNNPKFISINFSKYFPIVNVSYMHDIYVGKFSNIN